jgi:hypothetical protein
MSLETFTGKIADLVATNPTPSDPRSQGDDHLRGIKYTLQQTFPGFDGPLNAARVPYTPSGSIAENNVQAAIQELDAEKQPKLSDTVQVGNNATPANNFTLDASADNGTMRLARGNAGATTQDIMTVDAAGRVAFPQMVQTLQDVTASRTLGTTYTNLTSLPITVMVAISSTVAPSAIQATVAGVGLYGSGASAAGVAMAITFVVPVNGTYLVGLNAGTGTIVTWVEVR